MLLLPWTPVGIGDVVLFHQIRGMFDELGAAFGVVSFFVMVPGEVVEFDLAGEHGFADGFPFAEADGLGGAAFVEFPVEEFGELLAVAAFASEGGGEADGLGVLWGFDAG